MNTTIGNLVLVGIAAILLGVGIFIGQHTTCVNWPFGGKTTCVATIGK